MSYYAIEVKIVNSLSYDPDIVSDAVVKNLESVHLHQEKIKSLFPVLFVEGFDLSFKNWDVFL